MRVYCFRRVGKNRESVGMVRWLLPSGNTHLLAAKRNKKVTIQPIFYIVLLLRVGMCNKNADPADRGKKFRPSGETRGDANHSEFLSLHRYE